jgi:TonB family protein
VNRLLAVGFPLAYAAAVYVATRPPKPVYTMAGKTVMTVTDKPGLAVLHAPEPVYPDQALRDRVEGSVKLKVTIASDGAVAHAVPVSGPPLLRQAAIDTVRRWQFEPRPAEIEIDVPFSLGSPNRSIVPPEPLRRTPCIFAGHAPASVRVVAMIAPDGAVEFAHPVSGPSALFPAAVESVRQWTFRPMLRNGRPDYGTALVDVDFAAAR